MASYPPVAKRYTIAPSTVPHIIETPIDTLRPSSGLVFTRKCFRFKSLLQLFNWYLHSLDVLKEPNDLSLILDSAGIIHSYLKIHLSIHEIRCALFKVESHLKKQSCSGTIYGTLYLHFICTGYWILQSSLSLFKECRAARSGSSAGLWKDGGTEILDSLIGVKRLYEFLHDGDVIFETVDFSTNEVIEAKIKSIKIWSHGFYANIVFSCHHYHRR